jgi:bis(5'-nucleosyl)-tetraphosphatase (symmetrical)
MLKRCCQRLLSVLPRCDVRRYAEPLEQELSGLARLRFISNAFTRMRYCFPNGQLDMYAKEAPENAPCAAKTVVCHSGPVSNEYSIAFGHWASLEGKGTPEGIYALDTGCCWGGELTCLRWEDKTVLAAIEPTET